MQFDLDIVKMVPPGDGLGYHNGKAVFVPATSPGDRVRVFALKEGKKMISAALQEVLSPSPDRCPPPCPHYQTCGGCSLMHLGYDRQLELKQQMLAMVLSNHGIQISPEIVPSPETWHFRNKTRVRCVEGRLGFSERRSNQIVEIPECRILSPGIKSALTRLGRLGRSTAEFQILESSSTGEVAVSIQEGGGLEPLPGFVQSLAEDYGFGVLTLHSHGFAQSNPRITAIMIRDLLYHSEGAGQVCELFCGCGTFSLPLARSVGDITGFDVSDLSIQTAIENARRQALTNTRFQTADLNRIRKLPRADTIVADPPRKGLGKQLCRLMLQSGAGKVLYVSCNPASMARDIQELSGQNGFKLEKLKGYDMYCHTTHLEVMAVLTR